jgi:hypothetical protein
VEWCMFSKVCILPVMDIWMMCGKYIHNRRVVIRLWCIGGFVVVTDMTVVRIYCALTCNDVLRSFVVYP